MNRKIILIIGILLIGSVASLPIYVKPLDGSGDLQRSTSFDYVFNFTTSIDCTGVVLSNSSTIVTENDGVGFVDIDVSKITSVPSYLCEYVDGIYRTNHTLSDQLFRDVYARDVNITGNLSLGEKISFAFGEIIDNLLNGWVRITGGLNVTQNLSVDVDTLFVDSTNNNVGIGTTAPEEELHVVGDAKITGFVYSDTCPENMAYISKVGGFCIDKYEASTPGCEVVGNNCGSYQHANYCPSYCTPDNGVFGSVSSDTGTTAAAYSKVNVAPLVGVSQQQARQMCANVGKRLCTDEEWLAAANLQGKVYYLPATLSASPYDCVVDSTEYCSYFISNHACNTSYNKNGVSGCYSSEDVYDMVGNVWEWTNTTVDVINPEGSAASGTGTAGWYYANAQSQWQDSTTGLWTKYGNDGTYFPTTSSSTRAVRRGGDWRDGATAGLFCADLGAAPSSVNSYIGFRCCSSS